MTTLTPAARKGRPARCGWRTVADGGSVVPRTSLKLAPARSKTAPFSSTAVMPSPASFDSPAGRVHGSRRNFAAPSSASKRASSRCCKSFRYVTTSFMGSRGLHALRQGGDELRRVVHARHEGERLPARGEERLFEPQADLFERLEAVGDERG